MEQTLSTKIQNKIIYKRLGKGGLLKKIIISYNQKVEEERKK